MVDYARNDYAKVGHYSNILVEFSKDNPNYKKDASVKMCPFMHPLITRLAFTHPEWTIVGTDPSWRSADDSYILSHFTVYEGNENVGRIRRDGYYEHDFKYEIFNDRVEATRRKRGGTQTKDLKKALKVIEINFAPKSVEERRNKAIADMGNHIQSSVWRCNRTLNDTLQRITPALASYLVRNLDTIRAELESLGAQPQTLDTIPAKFETCKGIWQVEASRAMQTGTTVVLMNDRYLLIPDKSPLDTTVVTASQLDKDMAGKLGILKLFDKVDEAIEDVGMRLNATTFYIMK